MVESISYRRRYIYYGTRKYRHAAQNSFIFIYYIHIHANVIELMTKIRTLKLQNRFHSTHNYNI